MLRTPAPLNGALGFTMALNKPAIDRFLSSFESQENDIAAVKSPTLRKLLYTTALDPLARAAYGNIGHHERLVRLLDELTTWNARGLVSLPQLSLSLTASKRGRFRLAREVRKRLRQWPPGHVLRISSSPTKAELPGFADATEAKIIEACRYPHLFYKYRNNLVHEFREPGYGSEWSTDKDQAYYTSMINGPWELVFPVGFFLCIFEQAIIGLRGYLITQRINPYSQFEFGSLWRGK